MRPVPPEPLVRRGQSRLRKRTRHCRGLVEGTSKKKKEELCGRNSQNKMCVWPDCDHKAGDFVEVEVLDCTQATLLCKLV